MEGGMVALNSILVHAQSLIKSVVDFAVGIVWSFPEDLPILVVLLVGTGVFITLRLGFPQLKYVKHAIQVTMGKFDDPKDAGDITHFQALSAALSATIGIGNIAGTATAIHYGGPGALFWMWITAIFGTSLKYTECTLSMKFRKINPDGSASGGPMYYIEQGLGWKWLAIVFACSAAVCSFGTGNAIQAFTVADQMNSEFAIPTWITGLFMALLVGTVIIGGIKRIGQVASKLTPTMTVIYVTGGLLILLLNIDKLPGAFASIFQYAFSPPGMIGGFAGSAFVHTMVWGVKRGLFSNEAGQGSAPIAHAAAKTEEPVREGTVAMMGPYIDTIIVCSITGLCIIVTNAWTATVDGQALNGSPMTTFAFSEGLTLLKGAGRYIVTASVFLFALSTMISWSYYGDRSVQYLFGNRWVMPYRFVYCIVLFLGSVLKLETVWGFGDIALGIMTIPNLIAILALSGVTARISKEYYSRKHVPYKERMAKRL
jgi:AGCS family alanine or glycine:cation symporter